MKSKLIAYITQRWRLLSIHFVIYLIFYNNLVFFKHFSIDDYLPMTDIYAPVGSARDNGRFLMAFVFDIFAKLKINATEFQRFFGILFLITLTFCSVEVTFKVLETANIQKRYAKLLVNIGSLILFANVFMTEWFLYVTYFPQYILAISSSVFSSMLILSEKKSKKALGVFLLLIAVNSYQVAVAFYAFLTMLFILLDQNEQFKWGVVLKRVIVAVAYAVALVCINLILVRGLMSQGRIGAASRLSQMNFSSANFIELLQGQKEIWLKGNGLLPFGMLAIFQVIFLIGVIWLGYKRKVGLGRFIFCLAMLVGGQLVVYLPQVLSVPWLAARSIVPLFALFSICVYLIAYWVDHYLKMSVFFSIVGLLFLIINFLYVQKMVISAFQTNSLDHLYAQTVSYEIQRYEDLHNIEVKYIGFCMDNSPQYKYSQIYIKPSYEMFEKAYLVDWADIYALNYYTDLNLVKVNVPDEIKLDFLKKNWDVYSSEEQIIFDGDTVYLCVY